MSDIGYPSEKVNYFCDPLISGYSKLCHIRMSKGLGWIGYVLSSFNFLSILGFLLKSLPFLFANNDIFYEGTFLEIEMDCYLLTEDELSTILRVHFNE